MSTSIHTHNVQYIHCGTQKIHPETTKPNLEFSQILHIEDTEAA